MSNSVLFRPFALHDLTLPNRIVLAPMTRSRAGASRIPNRLMAEYYAHRVGVRLSPNGAFNDMGSPDYPGYSPQPAGQELKNVGGTAS